jgi:hypothetical protein
MPVKIHFTPTAGNRLDDERLMAIAEGLAALNQLMRLSLSRMKNRHFLLIAAY